MAASFSPPPVKKPPAGGFPARRGKIKAQIFGGIADSVVSAASRAVNLLGVVKKDGNDDSAPGGPPKTTATTTKTDGEDGRAV